MIAADKLSDKAQAVCAWHYGNAGSGCGQCPIGTECHRSKGHFGRLSEASLIEWRQRVNAAAAKVEL